LIVGFTTTYESVAKKYWIGKGLDKSVVSKYFAQKKPSISERLSLFIS